MNSAKYVENLVEEMTPLVQSGGVPLSEAAWKTAIACVGWPYVFGAWGAECTAAERKKRYNAHQDHTTIKTACKAFDGGSCTGCKWFPDGQRVRCYDCRGFTDWVLKQYGFDLTGEGATSQWNAAQNWCAKGEVKDGIPQGVIVCLFYYKKDGNGKRTSTLSHTGLYYNGETCECSNNVQHSKTLAKKWDVWAVPACCANELNGTPAAPIQPQFTPIKKGMKGDRVKAVQSKLLALGYSLPRYGADGDFGKETLAAVKAFQEDCGLPVTGVVDQATQNALDGAEPVEYTVIIPHLTEAQANALVRQYPGAKKEERGID